MKKYLKVLVIALLLILAEIFIYFFSFGDPNYFSEQLVMGIDGDSNGNFAVCLSLSNAMDFDIFFFDRNGEFVNKASTKIRCGSAEVKNYEDHLVVQSYPTSHFFDYKGERISDLSYCEVIRKSSYSYECGKISVEYTHAENGDETLIYRSGDITKILDIDYGTYKSVCYRKNECIFFALNYGLLLASILLKKRIKNFGKFEHDELKDE